jgi:mannose-6-phosphate isomerase-like protein (cupin superfamily)
MPDRELETGDVLTGPTDGETITDRPGRHLAVLAEREEISITRYRLAPGERGPDPHVHHEHTDAFYVLEGEMTFPLGPEAKPVRVRAGGLVAAPPYLIHSFANEGDRDARMLNLHTPDKGFAAYLRGLRDGDPDAGFDSFDPPADGGLPVSDALVSGPGEGERLVSRNRVAFLKGVSTDLCFAEFVIDGPFGAPHLHHHDAQVDSFYVLEGELELTVSDSVHAVGPDTLVSVPRGVRHTFAHRGSGKTRVLNIHAPDEGFADFLRRISD